MSLLHDFREPTVPDAPPQRFRAPTLEAALAAARAELGPEVEVIDANRIRRGGVGGFFATDLGVELTVQRSGAAPPSSATHEIAPRDDRIDAEFEARLALLDQAIYGDEPTIGIDRLLKRASGDDGYRRSERREVSFAEHLARELSASDERPGSDRPLPRRALAEQSTPSPTAPAAEPIAHERTPRADAIPASSLPADAAQAPAEQPTPSSTAPVAEPIAHERTPRADAIPASSLPADAAVDRADDGAGHDRRPAADEHPDAIAPDPLPRSTRIAPALVRNRRSPEGDDSAARPEIGHHAELAAGAVGRLISELAQIAPAHGSRVNQLSRLTVALTAADGSAVEFAAELNGNHHD